MINDPFSSPGGSATESRLRRRFGLGKRALGDTPLVEVLLPVGRHRLRLVNSAEKVDSFIEVTIKARETTVKKIAF